MVGHVLAAVRALEPAGSSRVVGHQREQVGPHIQALMPEAGPRGPGDAGGHRPRRTDRLEARPVRRPAPSWWPTATPRSCEGESLRAFAPEHAAARTRGERAQRRGRSPSATAGSSATTRARSRRSSRRRTRPREQPEIHEISRGILAFDADVPRRRDRARIGNDNAKGEYYLTDTVGLARERGLQRRGVPPRRRAADRGCQRPRPAGRARRELNRRIVEAWMRDGVT